MDHAGPESFYSNRKWCPACDRYVAYLLSVTSSFCVECGGEVRLLSKVDWESFSESMNARRPGPKRRKKTGVERKSA